jgi:uncharacterized membrane protein YebE (DUF533 family)
MTTHDEQFARRVAQQLDHGTRAMRAGTAYRLQLARQQALARLEPQRAPAAAYTPALAGAGAGMPAGGTSGRSLRTTGKLWVGVGLIALATIGYQGYQQWKTQQDLAEIEATDAALLTSDLPIDAYLDRGFQNWLKHLEEE